MSNVKVSFNTDSDTKDEATKIFNELGFDMTSALNIYLKRCVKEKGIPFDLHLDSPSKETLESISEMKQMKKDPSKIKTYDDMDEFWEAVHK